MHQPSHHFVKRAAGREYHAEISIMAKRQHRLACMPPHCGQSLHDSRLCSSCTRYGKAGIICDGRNAFVRMFSRYRLISAIATIGKKSHRRVLSSHIARSRHGRHAVKQAKITRPISACRRDTRPWPRQLSRCTAA